MSTIRKLAQFRQLSLNCETPPSSNRRRTLKKQYSQECHDDSWSNQSQIKVSLNSKNGKNLDRPPPLKIAWSEKTEVTEDAVIIKKCKEIRRPPTGKLVRHSSLEKDSILHSKHELAERLRQNSNNLKEKENNKEKEEVTHKPNLKIFLGHHARDDDTGQIDCTDHRIEPKLIQPLVVNDKFQIKKSKPKLEIPSPKERTLTRSNTVVVVPIVETNKEETTNEEMKAINNIIIRPVTASSRREQFQKRTNSAFHSTVRETPPVSSNIRPPLVRSSSAPSNKEKGKFLATKRKLKAKRSHIKNVNLDDEDSENSNSNKENPKTQKELNRTTAVIGAEVVTMVSLVSPSGSENEDEFSEDEKINNTKNTCVAKPKEQEKDVLPKSLSLRKTVKSVSFQQSSIHAVRSFSASFPARRASMLLSDGKPTNGSAGGDARAQGTKSAHARRGGPDDGERVPKRRLVRSSTVDCGGREGQKGETLPRQSSSQEHTESSPTNISIDIKTKPTPETLPDKSESPLEKPPEKNPEAGQPKCETPKEKQCWELYCKMTAKGINVSYDTILRGMLTPTEYRMRRKNTIMENLESSLETDAQGAETTVENE